MKKFMCENFLLEGEVAKKLYHSYSKEMPIFDFHCHLNPQEIWEDKKYKNISELWLGGDHYKWRAMRSNGVLEDKITGTQADDREKFREWARTVELAIGNPLYHWTHLELKRYFGIEEVLTSENSDKIFDCCNEMLQQDGFSARNLIIRSGVTALCTTDDPTDSLEYHIKLKNDESFGVKVLPTFRPDKGINIEKEGFVEWVKKLSEIVGFEISSYGKLKKALEMRMEFFKSAGCIVSDHGLDSIVYEAATEEELESIFWKGLQREKISLEEVNKYKGELLVWLGKEYNKRLWVMQIHTGAIRNNSDRMFEKLGADTGFDSIGDSNYALELGKFLNRLDLTDELPKTILYCLNPKDNYVLGTMIGCFQGGGIPGKIQFGSGWWFCDQRDGMVEQMRALGNLGLLARFVGMLTDSRSFLSYTRHEYCRRILCNLLGSWVENGEFPENYEILGKIVQDISYNNAESYFGIQD
ncbi:MAG: glucuronate isomerase [Fusobacteriaceae bacterium]